jgi:hypothetical protein
MFPSRSQTVVDGCVRQRLTPFQFKEQAQDRERRQHVSDRIRRRDAGLSRLHVPLCLGRKEEAAQRL